MCTLHGKIINRYFTSMHVALSAITSITGSSSGAGQACYSSYLTVEVSWINFCIYQSTPFFSTKPRFTYKENLLPPVSIWIYIRVIHRFLTQTNCWLDLFYLFKCMHSTNPSQTLVPKIYRKYRKYNYEKTSERLKKKTFYLLNIIGNSYEAGSVV